MRVGIVGGSIAGCAAAILLSRAGYAVSVFERSRGELVDRGAGIATPVATFSSLIAQDLLDVTFPYVHRPDQPFITRAAADDWLGHAPWSRPHDEAAMHWGALYRNLRRRVPDAVYHQGWTVTNAQMANDTAVVLHFADGQRQEFDLVLFADGYQSLGRRLLFPDVAVQYRGYVAWRGLLDEHLLADSAPLEGAAPRVSYKGMIGHLIPYFVPGRGGSTIRGERLVNWAAYLLVPLDALPQFLTDRDGRQHTHSLPPGVMRPEQEDRLKQLLQTQLPGYYAAIVTATRNTFVQAIYTVAVPAYHRGRIGLIGDAGAVATPITGSGVFKGMRNAIDLVAALGAAADVDTALAAWDAGQTEMGAHYTRLSAQMEEALIWATPDFSTMDAAETEAWWERTVPLRR
jgi:2-polyprenyl-6-methoxyphenol hydroxylase-like FAD-dependent oxidoreductase